MSLAERYRDGTATEEDKAELEKMVEEAAKKAGYTRRAYHGTNSGDFTVFDWNETQRADAGWYGRGHYFATHKAEAEIYGNRVIDAFLKMSKPFDFRKEVHSVDGIETHGSDVKGGNVTVDNIAFMINMAEKFPSIFGDKSIEVRDRHSGEVKKIKWSDLRSEVYKVRDGMNLLKFVDGFYKWHYEADNSLFGSNTYEEYNTKEEAEKNKLVAAMNLLFKEAYDWGGAALSPEAYYLGGDMEASDALTKALIKKEYDGAIQSEDGDEIVAFKSSQIKSADPVTYDDNGDIIPLSKRFNEGNEDIRWEKRSYSLDFNTQQLDTKALAEAVKKGEGTVEPREAVCLFIS